MRSALAAGLALALSTPIAAQVKDSTNSATLEARSAYFDRGFMLHNTRAAIMALQARRAAGTSEQGAHLTYVHAPSGIVALIPAIEAGKEFDEESTLLVGYRLNMLFEPWLHRNELYLHIRAKRATIFAEQELGPGGGVHIGIARTDTISYGPIYADWKGGIADNYLFQEKNISAFYAQANIAVPLLRRKHFLLSVTSSTQAVFGKKSRNDFAGGVRATYR